jgi:hypothetical protein
LAKGAKTPVSSSAKVSMVGAAMEAGIVTLIKIVGTLVLAMGLIPMVFLFSPGEKDEPEAFGAGGDHH